jgi:hypothetical protein
LVKKLPFKGSFFTANPPTIKADKVLIGEFPANYIESE